MTVTAYGTLVEYLAATELTTSLAGVDIVAREPSANVHPPASRMGGLILVCTHVGSTNDTALDLRVYVNPGDGVFYHLPALNWAIAVPANGVTYKRHIRVPLRHWETTVRVHAKVTGGTGTSTIQVQGRTANFTPFGA